MSWDVAPVAASIIAIGRLPVEAQAAIAGTGGRHADTLEWDAIEELAFGASLVVAALPGDIGHGLLEHFATVLDEAGLNAVVAFEAEALDAVAAVLMGPRVTLLCNPSRSDWATALALAAYRAEALHASVREGGDDAERLRRMNEEVARIAALLAGLVGGAAEPGDTVDERRRGYGGEPIARVTIDAAEIRRVIRARRLRTQFFPAQLMEDPGWDMLLDLFAAELEGAQVSVSSLCIAAGVPPTTALRWIARMADAGLLVRMPDAEDRRRAFLALSAAAGEAMRDYAAAAKRAGLPIV